MRIGLSATVAPLERVGEFLAGRGRPCEIVDERGLRKIRLSVTAPFSGAMAPMTKIAEAASELGRDIRTQLVFTNVRSQAERLAHEMALLEPQEGVTLASEDARARPRSDRRIGIHHSALERSVRHRVEAQLRAGEVHSVVCSSSLELGVDIGYIDRVCIVGGARGMTPALQRIGRAGHRPGAIAEGVVIAQDRDDIIEAAATKRCIADGTIEEIAIPEAPLDVLAQWLVASVCPERRWPVADALAAARRAAPYGVLAEADLEACLGYLSGGGAGDDPAHVRRIGRDGSALYGLGREASAAFFENAGTIPDERKIGVVARGGARIGSLEESFAATLQADDVFLLNGKTFRVRELRNGTLTVEAHAARPNVPAWASQIKGMPKILADEIARVRRGIAERLRAGGPGLALRWLGERYDTRGLEAAHAVRYVAQQAAVSYVPAPAETLIELYRMDRRQTAIFHTCAGRRANEALARIVAARVLRAAHASARLGVDDHGFLVELPAGKHLPDAAWGELLHAREIEADLLEGLRGFASPATPLPLRREHRLARAAALRRAKRRGPRRALEQRAHLRPAMGIRARFPAAPRNGPRRHARPARRTRGTRVSRRPLAAGADPASAGRFAILVRHRHLELRRFRHDGRSREHGRSLARTHPRTHRGKRTPGEPTPARLRSARVKPAPRPRNRWRSPPASVGLAPGFAWLPQTRDARRRRRAPRRTKRPSAARSRCGARPRLATLRARRARNAPARARSRSSATWCTVRRMSDGAARTIAALLAALREIAEVTLIAGNHEGRGRAPPRSSARPSNPPSATAGCSSTATARCRPAAARSSAISIRACGSARR